MSEKYSKYKAFPFSRLVGEFLTMNVLRGKRRAPSSSSRNKNDVKIKRLTEEENALIYKIDKWLKDALARQKRGEKVFSETNHARITGKICDISERQVYRIRKDEPAKQENQEKPEKFTKCKLDDFNKKALSRLVYSYYTKPVPEIPTVDKIHSAALEIPGFPRISRTSLYRNLITLGFACKKRNKKMNVYQRLDVVAARQKYLMKVREFRDNSYEIFYQDETWCNQYHTKEHVWQENVAESSLISDATYRGGLKVPSGKGKRLIINHLGSKKGFLKDCGECFVGKKDSADYHSEMNGVHFENWLKDKVLPSLPQKSVLVIDNAKYHSRQTEESKKPTTNWRKKQIQDWLREKGIEFRDPKDTIPILLTKSKSVNIAKEFILEKITKEYCAMSGKDIQILRLPIGHSELNPIELIWAQVKSSVASKNVTFKMKDVKDLVNNALNDITPAKWSKVEKHSIKVEKEFWKLDFGNRDPTEKFIIDLDGDSDSDCDSDSDEEDNEETS